MPNIYGVLIHYIDYYPLVAFVGLLLTGLNLPISEELIIITGALLCHKKPSLLPSTLAALYLGVICTDFFIYWVGTRVRKGTGKSKFFMRLIPEKTLVKMHQYLDKYGIFTYIICRFIPFGVRNTLFFTSGFFNLRFRAFAIYDLIAAMISINTLFFLGYRFGDIVEKPIKIAGIVLFVAFFLGVTTLLIRFVVKWRKNKPRIAMPQDKK